MNRKLLVVVAVAAVAALLAGAAVGRNLLSSSTPTAERNKVVHFEDRATRISIDYPGGWHRVPDNPADPGIALLATSEDDATTLLLVRVSASGLDKVTFATLPIVRKFTDGLLAADPRVQLLRPPDPVRLGGLPGYRYRYTSGSGTNKGAHDHYFLFKNGRLIQINFQAIPPERLTALEPLFQRIAASFNGRIT